jgi:ADP-heptose:LPS heptosyltransferase
MTAGTQVIWFQYIIGIKRRMEMNNLYQELSGQSQTTQQTNPNMMQRLYEFAKNFKGDPKQQVMELMKSRGINQQQYNDAVQQTNMIYGMLNRR